MRAAIAISILLLSALPYQTAEARNPFKFGEKQIRKQTHDYRLEMIMEEKAGYMAVIDGKLYRKGDSFAYGIITGIWFDHLEVTKNGKSERRYIE